jgi:integrase
MRERITKRKVDELRAAAQRDGRTLYVWDKDLTRFGLVVTKAGRASYCVQYRLGGRGTPSKRMSLGKHGALTPDQARQRARELLAQVSLGVDVARVRAEQRHAITLKALIPTYLKARKDELRPSSLKEVTRYLEKAWTSLHGLTLTAMRRQDVVNALGDIEAERGKVAADRAKAHLSSFFGWAIDRNYCDLNPTQNIRQRASGASRERVLSEAELVAIWKAAGDGDYGCILRLLILTGQRKTEIGDLQWQEIDFQRQQVLLPSERAKNKREHIVPLTALAMALLEGVPIRLGRGFLFGIGPERGFQGWSRAKAALDARVPADMAAWTIHDIRRSVATHLGENGFAQPHVIESILNHISGSKARMAGVYNKALYLPERRRSLDLWGNHLTGLIEGRVDNVVVLAARQ